MATVPLVLTARTADLPYRIFLVATCLVFAGCTPDDRSALPVAPGEIAEVTETITPGQGGAPMIFRAGGADCRPGQLLVADIADGVIQFWDHGVWSVVGHKGSGPGELQLPMHPRFFGDDAIAVLDVSTGRINFYGLDGRFRKSLELWPRLEVIWDYAVADDSLIAVVGTRGDGATQELVVLSADDSLLVRRTFVLPQRPASSPDHPLWHMQARVSMAIHGKDVYLTTPLIDSVYSLRLDDDSASGALHAAVVPIPGYRTPQVPDSEPRTPADIKLWWGQVPLVADVFAVGDGIMIPVATGTYWEADSSVVLRADPPPGGAWVVDSNLPPILGTGDGCGVSIRGQASANVSIVLWKPVGK